MKTIDKDELMRCVYAQRQRQLRKLREHYSQVEIARRSSSNPTSISRMLYAPTRKDGKNIGDETARAIEVGFELGAGWMDGDGDVPVAGKPTPSSIMQILRGMNDDARALVIEYIEFLAARRSPPASPRRSHFRDDDEDRAVGNGGD